MLWGSLYETFNAPPGWPTFPKGWVPQGDWTPDPGWPPAPAGWDFVVVRRRSYWLGVLDRPVLRDWLFWVAAVGVLLGGSSIGASGNMQQPDWHIFNHPTASDPVWVHVVVLVVLASLELLFVLFGPGVIRRGYREITFRDALAVRPGILDGHGTAH